MCMPPIVNSGPLLVTKDTLVHHIQYATLPTLGLLPAAIRDFLLHSVTGGYGLLSLSSAACRDCAKPLTCYSHQAASSAPCWLPERYCDAHPTNLCCGLLPPEAVQHRQASARTLLYEQTRRQHEASRGLETAGRRRVRQRSAVPLFGRRRVRQRSVVAQSGVSRAHANAASPCHHWECSNLLEAVLEGTCKKGCSGDSISRPNLPDFRAAEGLQGECCRIQPCPCRMPYTCIQPQ